ncbi:MAG: D-sedoheptulose 7-phosphate isomerase [Thermoplasmata archaeon]|nr:MAG: D-sedoheptulose 7-phosphate isomerase [Thermoplasmata archaeon]
MTKEIEASFKTSADLKYNIGEENIVVIAKISQKIIEAYRAGNKVVLFGNGGSAADAQHIAGELVSKYYKDRKGLPAMALHTNTSVLTAVANDYDYSEIFAKQIEAFVNAGDVAIGLSTSGDSPNVIKGLEKAKELGALTVGFTGEKGRTMDKSAELVFNVPSRDTPRIQEAHITAGHIICYLVERELLPD